MSEYIERAAALDIVRRTSGDYATWAEIARMPAADVVEVVRCRECIYGYAKQAHPGALYCRLTAAETSPDGFCHNGGRSNVN